MWTDSGPTNYTCIPVPVGLQLRLSGKFCENCCTTINSLLRFMLGEQSLSPIPSFLPSFASPFRIVFSDISIGGLNNRRTRTTPARRALPRWPRSLDWSIDIELDSSRQAASGACSDKRLRNTCISAHVLLQQGLVIRPQGKHLGQEVFEESQNHRKGEKKIVWRARAPTVTAASQPADRGRGTDDTELSIFRRRRS